MIRARLSTSEACVEMVWLSRQLLVLSRSASASLNQCLLPRRGSEGAACVLVPLIFQVLVVLNLAIGNYSADFAVSLSIGIKGEGSARGNHLYLKIELVVIFTLGFWLPAP